MFPPVIDNHAHVSPAPYKNRDGWLRSIFRRCDAYGVEAIIFSLLCQEGEVEMPLEELRKLAGPYFVKAEVALGFVPPGYMDDLNHPNRWKGRLERAIENILPLLDRGEVVALGETGLDYYWPLASYLQLREGVERGKIDGEVERRFGELKEVPDVKRCLEAQETVLRAWISLAVEYELPLIIHDREAFGDIFSILEESSIQAEKVMFHCYNSTPENAKMASEKGYWISLPASVVKTPSFQAAARATPLQKMLLETDSPYQSPIRGVWSEAYRKALDRDTGAALKGKALEKWIQKTKGEVFAEDLERAFPGLKLEVFRDGGIVEIPAVEFFEVGKHRNQNESTFVRLGASAIGQIKGCSAEEVCLQTTVNSKKLFNL